jgi:hypothetical protein
MHLAVLPHCPFYALEYWGRARRSIPQKHTIWLSSYQKDFMLWLTMHIVCLPLCLFLIAVGKNKIKVRMRSIFAGVWVIGYQMASFQKAHGIGTVANTFIDRKCFLSFTIFALNSMKMRLYI